MKKIVVAGVVSAVLALVVGAGAGWGVWHHYAGKGKPTAAAQTETVETLDESKSVFVTLPETIVTRHENICHPQTDFGCVKERPSTSQNERTI